MRENRYMCFYNHPHFLHLFQNCSILPLNCSIFRKVEKMTFVIKRGGRGLKPPQCQKPLPPLISHIATNPLNCRFNNATNHTIHNKCGYNNKKSLPHNEARKRLILIDLLLFILSRRHPYSVPL